MPRRYTVQQGDTLRSIAQRFLGSPAKSSVLQAHNRLRLKNRSDIYAGQVLSIPDMARNKKTVTSSDVDPEQLVLHLSDKQFYNFESVRVVLALSEVAHSFTISVVFDANEFNLPLQPFSYEPCQLTVGSTQLLSGRIEQINTELSEDGAKVHLSGRSLAGVVCDTPSPARPLAFYNKTLSQIITALLAPFGLTAVYSEADSTPFAAAVISESETVFSFVTRLAGQRGYLVTSNSDGVLFFARPDFFTEPVATIAEGEGTLISASAIYDGSQRYSDISIDAQTRTGERLVAMSIDSMLAAQDVSRPLCVQMIGSAESQADVDQAVKWERGRRIAESSSITVRLDGWVRLEDGALWEPGDVTHVLLPSCFIRRVTRMLVGRVTLLQSSEGTITELELLLPDSYTIDDSGARPWV